MSIECLWPLGISIVLAFVVNRFFRAKGLTLVLGVLVPYALLIMAVAVQQAQDAWPLWLLLPVTFLAFVGVTASALGGSYLSEVHNGRGGSAKGQPSS